MGQLNSFHAIGDYYNGPAHRVCTLFPMSRAFIRAGESSDNEIQ
nr:MAG TPA: hypothetical protein [Caudoviricetes sp.]